MNKLRKLTLKKEVIANISDDQMNRLLGGYGNTDWFCQDSVAATKCPNCPTEGEATCISCNCCPCDGCPDRYCPDRSRV